MFTLVIGPNNEYSAMTRCPMCKQTAEIPLPADGLYEYRKGAHVQKAFPDMNADDRERLISGTCPSCWNKMFGEEE